MSTLEDWDDRDAALSRLRTDDVGSERIERIRARCLEALAAQRPRTRPEHLGSWRRLLEPSFAFGLSALYLAAAFEGALALFR
jgi:hypothetical protein